MDPTIETVKNHVYTAILSATYALNEKIEEAKNLETQIADLGNDHSVSGTKQQLESKLSTLHKEIKVLYETLAPSLKIVNIL